MENIPNCLSKDKTKGGTKAILENVNHLCKCLRRIIRRLLQIKEFVQIYFFVFPRHPISNIDFTFLNKYLKYKKKLH